MKALALAVLPLLAVASVRAEPPLPDYTTPAQVGTPRPFTPPPIEQGTLANGMRVALMQSARQAVASVAIVFPFAGSSADPKEKSGLASLVADLMTEGTAGPNGLDGGEFAKAMQRFGASWSIAAGQDSLSATLFVGTAIAAPYGEAERLEAKRKLLADLDGAMGLLSDAIRRPLFAQPDVDRDKAETVAALEANMGDPVKLAARRIRARVFGAHPYGFATTPETVAGITREDIVAFHRTQVSPDQAMIGASGDLTLSELQELARKHFGDWQATREQRLAAAKAPPQLPGPAIYDGETAPPAIELIDYPGQPQATILGGQLGLRRLDNDRLALGMIDYILGSGENNRLELNLRRAHGWTYGTGTQLDLKHLGGDFFVIAPVRLDAAGPAIVEILKELRRLREEPVTEQELAQVKIALPFGFVKGLQPVQAMSAQAADITMNGLPLDSLATYKSRVLAMSAADLQAVARKYLRPDRMRWVVVGDAKTICPQLQSIHLAPVTVTDVAGKPEPACGGAG